MAKVACVGVGTVGRAWAVVFARGGYEVALFDSMIDEVERHAIPLARETLELLRSGGLLHEPIELVANRIRGAATLADAVTGATYIQESVAEKIEIKREVFAEIAAAAPADAILASSTSALPGSDFLGHVINPERCVVAHPVNPPSLIPLVEICPTRWSAEVTINKARQILTVAGMKPVTLLKEIDGFLLNRLQYTLVAEALHLVGEGYCSAEDIDRVMTDGLALRWASIGPFEVAHLNSPHGFQGFVDHLGGMMRHMGRDAKTSYDWSPDLIKQIHHSLSMRIPLSDIPKRQAWRNRRILEVRRLQHNQVS